VAGGDWDRVEETMTLPRIEALHRHWLRSPRVEVLVAAYLGYKPPVSREDSMKRLLDMFGVQPGQTYIG